jgi:hypothetical protein
MIEIIPTGDNSRVLGLHIRGPIDETDISVVAEVMERKLKQTPGRLRIFAEIGGGLEISPKALLEDLRVSVKHFGDVEREAIVSDEGWLGPLAELGDLLPGIEVRHFTPAERDQALAWING